MEKYENTPILSICIPTYNRKQRVVENVHKLLASDIAELEVCIIDNASEDETYMALTDIKDNRFKLIKNSKNIGQMQNHCKALFSGSGKYVVVVMDRDDIDIQKLKELIRYLETSKYDAVLTNPYFVKRNMVLNKKNACYIWTIGSHPSFIVYRRSIFIKSWSYDRLIESTLSDEVYLIPWTSLILTESYWDKKVLFLPDLCWVRENALGTSPYYSVKKLGGDYLYYMPQAGVKRLQYYCDLNAGRITEKDRNNRNISIYASELIRSTILVYEHTRPDSHMRIRYGFRHVKKKEYFKANKDLCLFMIKFGINHQVYFINYYYKVLLLFILNWMRIKIIVENKMLIFRNIVKRLWEKSYDEIFL